MNLPTLSILFLTSQLSFSAHPAPQLSPSEFSCLARNVYLEGRSLTETEWVKIAAVALNRSRNWHNYHYGSRSPNLCDIVSSREYSTRNLLRKPIKEPVIFTKISLRLKLAIRLSEFPRYSNLFYFSSTPSGVTSFRTSYR